MTSLGRPQDAFGDPVVRLKSWAWESRLCSDTGLEAPTDLARKFDVPRSSHFHKVREDGADPQRLQVGGSCLAKAVARLPEGQGAYQACTHDLWDALTRMKVERQAHRSHLTSAEFERTMRSFGIVRISLLEIFFGMVLGLPRQFPNAELPDATDLQLEPEKFASLDGLHMLLQLYRSAINEGALKFAGVFGEALEEAVCVYVRSCWNDREEIKDTWHWILHSRMLSWRPYLKPDALQLARWRDVWVDLARESNDIGATADTLPLSRRDRRKIFVHACAKMFLQQELPSHYARGTEVLYWLAANRDRITEQMMWALNNLKSVDANAAQAQAELQALIMPAHLFSERARPRGRKAPSTGFSLEKVFELIPVLEAK
ncbi:hypothetical protein E4A48_06730 [Xanthomonas cerealis pv. cerealis]|uniref:Uncharacterized protein n=1 Tax=Xanthomonas cerealis pv. cerealis TaxID=152263 RepID=A0A514EBL9_9XANT|nr:hypothetical protein [Xanthomonas translucens]QDI03427.1 hypothetical protein E4A48_06730 [Xanthomonas translucens pv. cerealis]